MEPVFYKHSLYIIQKNLTKSVINKPRGFWSTNLIHKKYQNDFARIIKPPLADAVPSRPRVKSLVYCLPASQMSHE